MRKLGLLTLLTAANLAASAGVPAPSKPRVEVCFVLDTTGSMGGLIEGAKQKIWSIASALLRGQPAPDLRVALVAYRDRGDVYITKRFDLTDDLDAVYGNLRQFEAGGGGDLPESVNQALQEAVGLVHWSTDPQAYRVIFLVGDAPPHMDYDQDVKYPDTCQAAARLGIVINTVQCGNVQDTTPVWQDIARRAEGRFAQVRQDGGMVAVTTPYDEELARLNLELAKTVVAYGDRRQQAAVHSKVAAAKAAAPAAAADRTTALESYSAKRGVAGSVVTGDGDLVQDVADGRVQVKDVKAADLPEALQKLDAPAREAYVKEQSAKRRTLATQVTAVSKQRQVWLDAELKRLAATGKQDSFDGQVLEMITAQAERKGIQYGTAH